MRYAYGITAALLAGGAAATLTLQQPVGAQVAQNAPGSINAAAPRPGAPMSFADLAAKLQPAVVNISTTQKIQVRGGGNAFSGTPFEELFRRFGGGATDEGGKPITREATSLGSGFIISADGYVVTNNHVISASPEGGSGAVVSSITVTLPDRKEYKATIVGRDQTSDLALLKIDAKNLPFVQFGDSTRTRVGDWVVAIGNPFGLGGTVTAGIVSALHRSIGINGPYDRYIQTDASINQGNSGGPMFDLQGNVIGINTAIFSPTGGNVGIGFAIPAEEAKPIIDQLRTGQRVRRGYLGVGIQPMTEDIASSLGLAKDRGEIVARVEPGEAAARAGIRQGDVIVKVDNQEITPDNTLSYIVGKAAVGARLPVELIREGQRKTVTVTLGERPPEDQLANAGNLDDDQDDGVPGAGQSAPDQPTRSAIGLGLQTLTPDIARRLGVSATLRGVVINYVDPSSDAAANGFQPRDIILQINNVPVTTVQAAAAQIADAQKAKRPTVLLFVQRGNNPPRYVGVQLRN
ncbi:MULTISPECIES: Do family serine endopeptidase [unclassified Sphingomonas]|uniref:Do family serine endopeptidase n=1 Tax=unclassified Sphingomonas TaxID=196159 RepID=UPI0006F77936|nr:MULTISPECIES: Do family serine endopeptidase [unclassified Sphingomonas]KQX20800.1 protease [Sphingomonas sp. Root1294]KQY68646.1 protease [Sphingomonas sp. Root50]KRB88390.1 protease [Sphingomonas sp. Root720]